MKIVRLIYLIDLIERWYFKFLYVLLKYVQTICLGKYTYNYQILGMTRIVYQLLTFKINTFVDFKQS